MGALSPVSGAAWHLPWQWSSCADARVGIESKGQEWVATASLMGALGIVVLKLGYTCTDISKYVSVIPPALLQDAFGIGCVQAMEINSFAVLSTFSEIAMASSIKTAPESTLHRQFILGYYWEITNSLLLNRIPCYIAFTN